MPLVSIFTAPLLAVYAAMSGRPSSLCTEQILMILPRRRGIMWRATAWPTRNTLSTLVRISSCHCASLNWSSAARRCIPALLTRMSIAPISRSMRSTAAATASPELASNAATWTVAPSSRNAEATPASLASLRPLRITAAPAPARPRASARPMPALEPVTSAVRPARLKRSRTLFMAIPRSGMCRLAAPGAGGHGQPFHHRVQLLLRPKGGRYAQHARLPDRRLQRGELARHEARRKQVSGTRGDAVLCASLADVDEDEIQFRHARSQALAIAALQRRAGRDRVARRLGQHCAEPVQPRLSIAVLQRNAASHLVLALGQVVVVAFDHRATQRQRDTGGQGRLAGACHSHHDQLVHCARTLVLGL